LAFGLICATIPGVKTDGSIDGMEGNDVIGTIHLQQCVETKLFDFESGNPLVPWLNIDDGVMGGLSQGRMIPTDQGHACFTGVIRLENNGGFSSIQSPELRNTLHGYDGLRLRVRGDGRAYSFGLHQRHMFQGTSYRCRFETVPLQWTEVVLPFQQFVLMRFGQRAGVSPVSPQKIERLSIVCGDKQAGPFTLELGTIAAWRMIDIGEDHHA
jgi:NADH dehydrogenase [ubiquinone] 1 alpha subcomplex assembly factor 1